MRAGRDGRGLASGKEQDGPPLPAEGWAATDERGERRELADLLETPRLEVHAMARRIVARLSVRPKGRDRTPSTGSGVLRSIPYRYQSDDVDLDRTLEVLTEHPMPEDTDIVVRERVRAKRAVVLMVDVSGSMRGEKTRIAAATVGALAGELRDEDLAVVAFWKDAALVEPLAGSRPPDRVLDDLLRIPARGLTNVAFGLETGLAELRGARARTRVGVLLSDAVHNAGPDPREVAARFPGSLHVLLQTDGEHDDDLGAQVARRGRGGLARISDYRDVAPALSRLLG